MNITKFFRRCSWLAHLLPPLQDYVYLDYRNVVLLQINVFGRNINETTQARYLIKVTVRPSFTRLRVIRQINRVH